MKQTTKFLSITLLAGSFPFICQAQGPGTSGGRTLLQAPGARSSALGEAFTTGADDITAFSYNPASLQTLRSKQASFLLERGIADDSFSHFMVGVPGIKRSLGFSLGYFNGGRVNLYDGINERQVVGKQDINLALGVAGKMGASAWGVTAKYLSSTLGEVARAQAFAGDIGVRVPLHSKVAMGASLQNMGTKLQFRQSGQELPRVARAGLSILFFPKSVSTNLTLDLPYYMNEREARPAAGIEVNAGLLTFRAGYRSGSALGSYSFGTGFLLGQSSLDYAFGMVDQLNSRHHISWTMKFGESPPRLPFSKNKDWQATIPLNQKPIDTISFIQQEDHSGRAQ